MSSTTCPVPPLSLIDGQVSVGAARRRGKMSGRVGDLSPKQDESLTEVKTVFTIFHFQFDNTLV